MTTKGFDATQSHFYPRYCCVLYPKSPTQAPTIKTQDKFLASKILVCVQKQPKMDELFVKIRPSPSIDERNAGI